MRLTTLLLMALLTGPCLADEVPFQLSPELLKPFVDFNIDRIESQFLDIIAAEAALEVQTPTKPGATRFTLSSGIAGRHTAYGFGVSHRFKGSKSPVLSLGLASGSGNVILKTSFGIEFGGQ